jgi:hypothetical protein
MLVHNYKYTNIQFSVIGITETWLQNASHLVDINGLVFFINID